MKIPQAVENLIEAFERLPGIGPKTAQRLTFYLLQVPKSETDVLERAVRELKEKTVICPICKNIGDNETCSVCSDSSRDRSVICVVENALDTLALERAGSFKGLYHVLGGAINPLENIGPEELFIDELLQRLQPPTGPVEDSSQPTASVAEGDTAGARWDAPRLRHPSGTAVKEIIIATNPTMEGEATAMYIRRLIRESGNQLIREIKVTRIGHGLPIGADLEYADERTLGKALEGRREY